MIPADDGSKERLIEFRCYVLQLLTIIILVEGKIETSIIPVNEYKCKPRRSTAAHSPGETRREYKWNRRCKVVERYYNSWKGSRVISPYNLWRSKVKGRWTFDRTRIAGLSGQLLHVITLRRIQPVNLSS